MPRLNGSRTTCAPCAAATSAVRSTEPSDTTTTSKPESNACSSSITPPMLPSSLSAGTIAIRRAGTSSADTCRLAQAGQLEEPARAVPIGVLVEDPFTRTAPHLLRLRGIRQQLAVRSLGLVCIVNDEQLRTGLEPAVDSLVRVRHDRRARRRELERPRRRRRMDGRVRAARDAEVDVRRGDRARKGIERHVADGAGAADVALKVAAAEREVDIRKPARRFADHRLHPLAAKLVAVAVEEDV